MTSGRDECEWEGKMPTNAVPLTDKWCAAQIAAGTIVPPPGDQARPLMSPLIGVAWIILIAAAIAPWALIPFGR